MVSLDSYTWFFTFKKYMHFSNHQLVCYTDGMLLNFNEYTKNKKTWTSIKIIYLTRVDDSIFSNILPTTVRLGQNYWRKKVSLTGFPEKNVFFIHFRKKQSKTIFIRFCVFSRKSINKYFYMILSKDIFNQIQFSEKISEK